MARKKKQSRSTQSRSTSPTSKPNRSEESAAPTHRPPRPLSALNKSTSVTKIASLLVLVVIIVLILILFYRVMANFVLPLFLAALFSVLFRPIHSWMLDRFRGKETLAAGLTTASILGIVLLPFIWIGSMAIGEAMDLQRGFRSDRIVESLNKLGRGWPLNWKGRPFQSQIEELDRLFAELPEQVPEPGADTGLVEPVRAALKQTEILLGKDAAGNRLDSANASVLGIYESLAKSGFEKADSDSPSESAVKTMVAKGWVTKTIPVGTTTSENELLDTEPAQAINDNLNDTVEVESEIRFVELENLVAELDLALQYLRNGKKWIEFLDTYRDDGNPNEDSAATIGLASELDEAQDEAQLEQTKRIEHKLSSIRTSFPRLEEHWLSVRAQIHGGNYWMRVHDIFFPTTEQVERGYGIVEEFGFKQLPTLPTKATAVLGQFIAGMAIMVLGIFYFLKDGPGMIRAVMRLSPLDDRYEKELLSEFDSVSRAVVMATLLSALAQGLLAGIGYYFAGFEAVLMLTMLTMVIAMVPVIGAAAVWVPSCIWLAVVDNRVGAAIVLALYGVLIVSMVDNLIKPFVLHGQSNLHPLLALLSVLGGVSALGPIGIIVGPMVVSFLQALLNMLHLELQELDRRVDSDPHEPAVS